MNSPHGGFGRVTLRVALVLMLIATTTLASAETGNAQEPEFWVDVLEVGDCFDAPPDGELPEPIPCDELHEEEIYAIATLDYDADDELPEDLGDIAFAEVCDDATVDFAGRPWDELPFVTFALFPTEDEWEAGDRTVMCSAGGLDDGEPKIGTAAGAASDRDEIVVARAGLEDPDGEEFEDFLVFGSGMSLDDAGSLTDWAFDIPLRRPSSVERGFIFQSVDDDSGEKVTTSWGYDWETGELDDLGSVIPGYEVSSLAFVDDDTIFAARETSDDDWDIYRLSDDDGVEAIADESGDQHFLTLTPDAEHIVYHSKGDLWIMEDDGSEKRRITSGRANDFESAVSPDGEWIAFASDRSGNDDIWLVSIDGGDAVNLTDHPGDDSWPVWSDDGSTIFFATDRVTPDGQGRIMTMTAEGNDHAWFAAAPGSQPIIVNPEFADDVLGGALTLSDRFDYEVVEGDAGSSTGWVHSSGRLGALLPAGWRVGEFADGIGFLVSPQPSAYYNIWEVDAVIATLIDEPDQDAFFELLEETAVVQDCDEQISNTEGIVDFDDGTLYLGGIYECGDNGAVGSVAALYAPDIGSGVIVEGQRDNEPNEDDDMELLLTILTSITWDE